MKNKYLEHIYFQIMINSLSYQLKKIDFSLQNKKFLQK